MVGVRFRRQIQVAVAAQKATYADLLHMAARWGQSRNAVQRALRVALATSLEKVDTADGTLSEYVRKMLAEHERREPYTELPENISMQLRRIDQELKDKPEHIHQLATSLNALYQKNQRDLSVQKLLSALGFLIGVAGLFVPVFFGS